MMFTIGILVGFVFGGVIGAAIMGWVMAAKMSDLQDRLDAWEVTRWSTLERQQ